MDTMTEFVAPILERHDGQTPTLPLYSVSRDAKLHLRTTCTQGRQSMSRQHLQPNSHTIARYCTRCVKPGVLDTVADATIADAFMIAASKRARFLLQSATSRYGSDSKNRDEIAALLEFADRFAGGTHPSSAALRNLVPGLAQRAAVAPAQSAAVFGAQWAPGPQEYEWARVLSGDPTKADVMWGVFRNNVRFGLSVPAAATSTVMSLESSGTSNDKLPDVLASTRAEHATTRAWMTWEWEHSCEQARCGLVAVLTGVVDDAVANPERFGWIVAATTQTTAQLASQLAAGYGWEFHTGHDPTRSGVCLIACPAVIFESLKILNGVPGVTPLEDLPDGLGASVHTDPGILRIAETLKQDRNTLSWTDALERARLVADISD